eukprot:1185115-Prorocentrum_minimum.AAC.1
MALANARDATTSRNNDVNVQRKWTGVIYPIKTKWTYSGSYRKPLRTSIHKPQPRLCPKEATHRVYRNPHKIEPAWTGTGVLRCVTTESPHALIQKTYHRVRIFYTDGSHIEFTYHYSLCHDFVVLSLHDVDGWGRGCRCRSRCLRSNRCLARWSSLECRSMLIYPRFCRFLNYLWLFRADFRLGDSRRVPLRSFRLGRGHIVRGSRLGRVWHGITHRFGERNFTDTSFIRGIAIRWFMLIISLKYLGDGTAPRRPAQQVRERLVHRVVPLFTLSVLQHGSLSRDDRYICAQLRTKQESRLVGSVPLRWIRTLESHVRNLRPFEFQQFSMEDSSPLDGCRLS